jgi:hypothetical protein
MNINKIFGLSLCLLTTAAFANNNSPQPIPAFAGGLNISQITDCETHYKKTCPIINAKTAMDGIAQQEPCIEKKMMLNKSCAQASAIRKLTSYSPTKIKKYGSVVVFYTTSLADGIDTYYIVDTAGNLIKLNDKIDLNQNKQYLQLKQKYPNIALTSFLYWTKINEDLFPKNHLLANKNQQLIFKQDLRDDNCLRCKRIGFANVAYEFNPHGVFLASKVLKVNPLP